MLILMWMFFIGNIVVSVALGTIYGEPYGFLVFGALLMFQASVSGMMKYLKRDR